ncbi:MAG: hypothetical protein WDN08_11680 [Rhizomicrobium sp.]
MPQTLEKILQSPRAPWAVAAVLLLGLVLVATGAIDLHRAPAADGTDYAAAAERLAGADRSQPLRMKLDGQFPGPLQDTTIQRWRDPVDGTICYIYLPIVVPHSAGPPGLVQYGQSHIGSISCLAPHR